eukprot:CAMPEP_0119167982 /NCGR_PEP_ID=MMETSP1315-20130426/6917_1 /TAXON_ID=676789 /ORGANISM="Prasinoderma singularis, Strain RCC927" /LENGTH=200 /DNA_ID=CAMNT_0007161455 /DNA_START=52 /DNA_END=655 /DNA_ORIENTATION=-
MAAAGESARAMAQRRATPPRWASRSSSRTGCWLLAALGGAARHRDAISARFAAARLPKLQSFQATSIAAQLVAVRAHADSPVRHRKPRFFRRVRGARRSSFSLFHRAPRDPQRKIPLAPFQQAAIISAVLAFPIPSRAALVENRGRASFPISRPCLLRLSLLLMVASVGGTHPAVIHGNARCKCRVDGCAETAAAHRAGR